MRLVIRVKMAFHGDSPSDRKPWSWSFPARRLLSITPPQRPRYKHMKTKRASSRQMQPDIVSIVGNKEIRRWTPFGYAYLIISNREFTYWSIELHICWFMEQHGPKKLNQIRKYLALTKISP
jgi:hypothetical protein